MSDFLPRIGDGFTGNGPAIRCVDSVERSAASASWQFCAAPVTKSPGTCFDQLGLGIWTLPWRYLLQIGLMALLFALVLEAASIAGSFPRREVAPPPHIPEPATIPLRVVSDHHAGLPRPEGGWILRLGRRARTFLPVPVLDNPNDDETSDDPADDDDAWEDLEAFDDVEVPGPAWLPQIDRCQSECETPSGLFWPTRPPVIPFLTFQRLRC